uniref:DUF3778 domain-containing protein n=1 Tax=Oryza glumipatula TaxID=40148 RepID=A0A0D9ZFR6_9ORYZ
MASEEEDVDGDGDDGGEAAGAEEGSGPFFPILLFPRRLEDGGGGAIEAGDGGGDKVGDGGGADPAISFSAISIISAGQKLICSHSSASSWKVGCSSDSPILLFPNRRNHVHVGFVIRVELGLPEQFRLIGLMLELLRFNDESRGDPLLSPVTHTPKSTAQQQTSVLCRFRGGSRWGLTVCQADCTSFEAQGSSRRGFAADPCRLAPFSDVRLFQEGCFRSSVNPPFLRMALLLGYVMGFIP